MAIDFALYNLEERRKRLVGWQTLEESRATSAATHQERPDTWCSLGRHQLLLDPMPSAHNWGRFGHLAKECRAINTGTNGRPEPGAGRPKPYKC